MTDFSVCVFDKNRCKEKALLFVETLHEMFYGKDLYMRASKYCCQRKKLQQSGGDSCKFHINMVYLCTQILIGNAL